MRAFREAVEAGDLDAVEALLADDVVFTSPVVFKPYHGKAITAAILRAVSEVFQDFRYVREIGVPDGPEHALVFTARVGDRELTGCDFLRVNEAGLIDDFMVMVRPLSGAHALAEAMGARFERIAEEAAARPV
ncbi:nuclear transport factor 2 family protein [Streptomyces sp. WI03-4A]|uniref:nuclear transport factor 2 family protein n=1 Tax=Streptomyces sp. WI03-4A TaxID=3028706 RepID=UPI0029B092AE|nr:nuclear transport factor 2 family protein [Streptomyces sp. WI03-4A]MDX2590761.1 nuclear transport factor 2 family protein [Streptomyces sp. WI03-4A]